MLLTGIKQACTRQSNKLAKSQCHNYWNGLFVESKTNSTYSTSAGSPGIILYSTNSANMAFRCKGHSIAALLVLSTKHRAGTIGGGLAVGISIEGALGESVQRRFSAATIGRIFRFQHTSMKQKVHDFYAQIVFQKMEKWGHHLKLSIWFCQYWWLQTTSLCEHFHQTKVHLCVFCPHGQFAFFGAHVSEPFK